jgi:initiation factor 1A
MVKNTKGGNKAKKQGRKFAQPGNSYMAKTRYSQDPDEIYACCIKLLGNGMCNVTCIDGKDRLCFIRKKFRGRGKRDNTIAAGTWLLVGLRSFETSNAGKLDKCDLLEVYNNHDKVQLKQKETRYENKWDVFERITQTYSDQSNTTEVNINFTQQDDDDDEFITKELPPNHPRDGPSYDYSEESITVADI